MSIESAPDVVPADSPFGAPERCAEITNCTLCAEESCFWCRSKQKCSHGADLGCGAQCTVSPGGQCFNVSQCSEMTTCGSCASLSGCGWCETTQTCSDVCAIKEEQCFDCIKTKPQQCPAKNCSTLTHCSDCTQTRGCGWCAEEGKCLAANTNGTGPCNGHCKYWSYKTCAVACRFYSSCGECTQSDTGCVWCAGENQDGVRESACIWRGEKNVNCSARFELPDLPCPHCSRVSNCTTCLRTGTGHCGWCERRSGRSACVEGDRSGPYSFSDCNPDSGFWASECQPWNHTIPIPSPPPVKPPQTPPAAPPTRPPNPNPPQQQPHPPASAPFSHVPVVAPEPPETAPTSAPATQLAPDNSNIIGNPPSIFYSPVFDILIGVGAGAVVVLITGVIWWRCHVKTRYRYRAIG
eukprot:TRINITY_DN1361_c0_g1_i2.p1 TRINITY_DN1361_c0_g1~~TRINITY_DN1361_c0_g1_i2.p1  ORF type:complete len:409 (-),score=18.70 TRINITY_DN1361_c0_g1_i2:38-1264(-)